jgi:hypothetical protein
MISSYTIIANRQAIELVLKNNKKKVHDFSSNLATAYQIDNGRFIVVPMNGDKSLLFENSSDYKEFLKHPDFPAPDREPCFEFRNEIKDIENNLALFAQVLSEELHSEVNRIESKEDIRLLFHTLNEYIKNDNDFYFKGLVPLGVTIGEFLRIKGNLKWQLSPVYAFQPYLIPILSDYNNREFPIWSILEEYLEDKRFDFDNFLTKLKSHISL